MTTVTGLSFGPYSTSEDVLGGMDLSGRHVLVTGVSAGLGVETTRALLARGAYVTGLARDLDKAREATMGLTGQDRLALANCDLASLASVRAAADGLHRQGAAFDVVIANAGVMALPEKRLTVDGFEMQLGTNHLGHFALVNRIIDLFKPGGRLVNLASAGHRFADLDLDDPNFERTDYQPFVAYGRSKTANILFAVEFDRRHRASGLRATAVHPGAIRTELLRHMSEDETRRLVDNMDAAMPEGQPFAWKTMPQGAATTLWAGFVAAPDAVGGRYCEDCHVADISAVEGLRQGVQAYAMDTARARAMWARSEQWVGEQF